MSLAATIMTFEQFAAVDSIFFAIIAKLKQSVLASTVHTL